MNKPYTVMIGGLPHTLELSEATARKMGAEPATTPKARRSPKNKARTPRSKSTAEKPEGSDPTEADDTAEPEAEAEPAEEAGASGEDEDFSDAATDSDGDW